MRTLHATALYATGTALQQSKAAEAVLNLLVNCQISQEHAAIHFGVGTLRSLASTMLPAAQDRAKKFMLEIFSEPTQWLVGTLIYVVQLLAGIADGRQTPQDKQCVELVSQALQCHSSDSSELTVLGLRLLGQYVKHADTLMDSNDITDAMHHHQFDQPIQLAGCSLLSKLPINSTRSEAILDVTLAAAAAHSDSPSLIDACMKLALKTCTKSDKATADRITPLLDAAKLLRANKVIAQQLDQLEALG